MKRRSWDKWLVFGVTAAVVGAVFLPEDRRAETVTATKAAHPMKTPSPQEATPGKMPAPQARVELERLSQQKAKNSNGSAVANAFNSTSWYVAPPPPPPSPPPPAPEPVAPPLPFTYLGRYEDKSKTVVILAKGDQVYTVSEGEVIEGTYRVDEVADDAVNFIYLPMKIAQSLATVGVPDNRQLRRGMGGRNGRP